MSEKTAIEKKTWPIVPTFMLFVVVPWGVYTMATAPKNLTPEDAHAIDCASPITQTTQACADTIAADMPHVSKYEVAGALHNMQSEVICDSYATMDAVDRYISRHNNTYPSFQVLHLMGCDIAPANTAAIAVVDNTGSAYGRYRMELDGRDVAVWAYQRWK